MGYRNSTPTNVMTSESKLMRRDERAGTVRNFWIKTISSENKELIGIMNRLYNFIRT